jgi:hypothetical protein
MTTTTTDTTTLSSTITPVIAFQTSMMLITNRSNIEGA